MVFHHIIIHNYVIVFVTISVFRVHHLQGVFNGIQLLDETKDKKWTAEDDAKYNQLTGEITDLDKSIERHQKVLDLEAEQRIENRDPKKGGKRDTEDLLSEIGIFDTWMRRGEKGMNAEQAAKYFNTMSTTTGSEGGYTVPTTVGSSLIESLKDFGGMRSVAEVIATATGNPMSFPSASERR